MIRSRIGTERRIAAPSEPGQLTEGHQKRPVPSLVLAATAGSDPIRSWDYRGSLHSSNLLDHSGALFVARVIATTEVQRELPRPPTRAPAELRFIAFGGMCRLRPVTGLSNVKTVAPTIRSPMQPSFLAISSELNCPRRPINYSVAGFASTR